VRTRDRKQGRPRKKHDGIEFLQFVRAAMVMSAYDEARARGEKHRVAVIEAVDYVKRFDSDMKISETEVKRVLASFRPKTTRKILRFEPSIRSEDDLHINRLMRGELAALQEKRGITLPDVPNYDLSKSNLMLTIRIGTRPVYPRHNAKILKH